jgi:hypothetical protein
MFADLYMSSRLFRLHHFAEYWFCWRDSRYVLRITVVLSFYLIRKVSETGFCLRIQVELAQLGLVDRHSFCLRTPTPFIKPTQHKQITKVSIFLILNVHRPIDLVHVLWLAIFVELGEFSFAIFKQHIPRFCAFPYTRNLALWFELLQL